MMGEGYADQIQDLNEKLDRIADAIERYVDEKIESDKVVLGILRDIKKGVGASGDSGIVEADAG